jgi:two-component system, chemotaxis family, CheB/CheR fusion protein
VSSLRSEKWAEAFALKEAILTPRKKSRKEKESKPTPVSVESEARGEPGKAGPGFPLPVVGIGASAGGLAAFEAFFSGMPADTDPGMAFVLVQHLAPDHKSILTHLVRRYTRMQVSEVEDGVAVQRNCAYIIPPNRDMAFLNGTLQLLEPSSPRGHRMPIDFFFRSLAQDQHERAIGIVLSGTGSDGTMGVRAIKGEGGMVIAQNPETTEFDGMPRSAINTGLVDYILPPAGMPTQLMGYVAHAFGKSGGSAVSLAPTVDSALKKIFLLLRTHVGHDFSRYKPSTIHRRIERRMAVHMIDTMDGYVRVLQQSPAEVEALFRDLLIGVTSFFRDPEAFRALGEQVIPKLFAGKDAVDTLRVWSPGCSTGEEAYSLAILLAEQRALLKRAHPIQIFATDIDSQAIATARTGLYPASIAADLSQERLARFFTAESDGSTFRINKSIRDMLIFSEQDVIKDPPFSKLDLISCRNLLIYMSVELQKRLIPLFHYALNPSGFLFLGTSETVGVFDDLFSTQDRKSKLYVRRQDSVSPQRTAMPRFFPPSTEADVMLPRSAVRGAVPPKSSLREVTEQALLQHVVQAGALVDGQGDIFYLHGRTGMWLEPAPGEAGVNNILKMAREGLRRELTTALHNASSGKEIVRAKGLRVKNNGDFTTVDLAIRPMAAALAETPGSPLYLVILEEAASSGPAGGDPSPAGSDPSAGTDARIAALQAEMQTKEEYIRSAKEEMEASNEELKSSNEEMQSVNEELHSTNEELETSKEELQSVNEELATVNTELQAKVVDLSRINNDMNNLLAGTGIATVFVDLQLSLLRFTPASTRIVNMIQSDVGRPLGHIVSNLVGYDRLVADAREVLDTLVPKEVEVETTEGHFYSMRIQPYRTVDNVIEGAVFSFLDITEIVRARDALRKANEVSRLAVVVRDSYDAITLQDLDGRILAWSPGAVRMYGWSETEALEMNIRDRIPRELREGEMARLRQLSREVVLKLFRTRRLTKGGVEMEVSIVSTALVNDVGQVYGIATTERAIDRGGR